GGGAGSGKLGSRSGRGMGAPGRPGNGVVTGDCVVSVVWSPGWMTLARGGRLKRAALAWGTVVLAVPTAAVFFLWRRLLCSRVWGASSLVKRSLAVHLRGELDKAASFRTAD